MEQAKRSKKSESRRENLVFGLILIAVGSLIFLSRQGLVTSDLWRNFWPLAIVAVGLADLFAARWGKGFLVMAVGVSLQLHVLDYLEFQDIWPLLLIIVGASMALGAWNQPAKRGKVSKPAESSEFAHPEE